MANINEIVSISITRQTLAAKVASFNGIMIADEFLESAVTPAMTERVRPFASLSEISDAGFATTSPVYLAAKALFSQNPNPRKIYVGRKLTGVDGTETWTEALQAMYDENKEWYGFGIASKTLADLQTAATWAETAKRLFGISDDDPNIIDSTGDIAEYINTQNLDHSFVFYHPDADLTADDPFIEFAVMGKMFSYAPGSINWAHKNLKSVSAYEITTAQQTTAFGKECNLYQEIGGNAITRWGTVGSGEYIDIIRGTDWLESIIQSNVYTVLLNNNKIAFTNSGIQSIVSAVNESLQSAVDVGFIIGTDDEENGYSVEFPLASEVSQANKVARNLPDIIFRATYQGAINKTNIQGYIGL